MALAGVIMLAWPFITHMWADRIQGGLEDQFAQRQVEAGTGGSVEFTAKEVAVGDALTRIKIPKLDVNVIVVEGVTDQALRAGAGHYPNTALPGEPGNVSIAGHRTGFGEPFRRIDRLKEGDEIILETPIGRYTYEVVGPFDNHKNPWVTHAKDWTVIQPTIEPSLTLTTCDPPGTSKNRLIVRARLVNSEPLV